MIDKGIDKTFPRFLAVTYCRVACLCSNTIWHAICNRSTGSPVGKTALFGVIRMPSVLPIAGAAMILVAAAILASLLPAVRASRVDVMQVLRSG
jgi:ABC-type lipoprotein release transport system permease subunit